jgi:hypothetical protein
MPEDDHTNDPGTTTRGTAEPAALDSVDGIAPDEPLRAHVGYHDAGAASDGDAR